MSHDESKPVRVVSPGVVRCLLKQTYYLRIPKNNDLEPKTVRLPPDEDVSLEYREFDLVRADLIALDQKRIVKIIAYPQFLPIDTDLNMEVYQGGVLISSTISGLNFVGSNVVDLGSGIASITGSGTPIGGSNPLSVGLLNAEGIFVEAARADHVHQGVHSLAASLVGTPRYGDLVLQAGTNILITDSGSGVFTLDVLGTTPSPHASTHLPIGSDPLSTAAGITLTALTTNAVGTANSLARSDHSHTITTGNVGFLGSGIGSNQTGTGAALARADHVHRWQQVTSFGGLPGSPTNGQIVYANYGLYKGFYAYDSTRAKWLSTELLQVGWNSSSNVNSVNVVLTAHNDDTQQDNDYPLMQPITLTGLIGAQVNAITSGNETRFEISSYDLASSTLTQNVASVTLTTVGEFSSRDLALDIDVADLNVLSARRVKLLGSDSVTRPMMLLQYRSRLT